VILDNDLWQMHSVTEYNKDDVIVAKYYLDSGQYHFVTEHKEQTLTSSDLKSLQTSRTMVFLTSSCDGIEDVSSEFKEIGLLLAKLGLSVRDILEIVSNFYNRQILTKNPICNVLLPSTSLCAYKENEKIVL